MDEYAVLAALLEAAAVEQRVIEPLARYGVLLLEANRRFNLSGVRTPAELVPHLLDSVTVAPYVRDPLVDVGSGGGLPAIPLAIVTGAALTLVESTTKKAAFLEATLAALGLRGRIVPFRAEVAARDPLLREKFASATARAVASAPAVLELTVPFLRIGGVAVLQRGKLDERERNALSDAAPMLGAQIADEIALEGERRIIVLRKIAETPQRFPRRTGVPEKRPLCLS